MQVGHMGLEFSLSRRIHVDRKKLNQFPLWQASHMQGRRQESKHSNSLALLFSEQSQTLLCKTDWEGLLQLVGI